MPGEDTLTPERIAGLVRHVINTLGGALVAKGILSGEELEAIGGAIVVLVPFIWSWIAKRPR